MNSQRFKSELKTVETDGSLIGTLALSGALTIQDANELKGVLLEVINQTDHCLIDLSMVNQYDLSSIQILFSAVKTALGKNKSINLDGECPDTFYKAVREAGFERLDWLCFKVN